MARFMTISKRVAGAILHRGLSFINKHPALQRYILLITRTLGLYPLARTIHARLTTSIRTPYGFTPKDIAHLSPRARQIYFDLKAAIERHQKEMR